MHIYVGVSGQRSGHWKGAFRNGCGEGDEVQVTQGRRFSLRVIDPLDLGRWQHGRGLEESLGPWGSMRALLWVSEEGEEYHTIYSTDPQPGSS